MSAVQADAVLSVCGRYRYWLTREWQTPLFMPQRACNLAFIMLNPSTAGGVRWMIPRSVVVCGLHVVRGITVVNLFALRTKDPKSFASTEIILWGRKTLDAIVFITADSDFAPLMDRLREKGILVYLCGLGRVVAQDLLESTDMLFDTQYDLDKSQAAQNRYEGKPLKPACYLPWPGRA